ncbi:hypothetical protein LTR70_010274 [Exophiala xenobiotica]|uniref:ER transporter 6TM N-terminal domain-containing protein n=1 Tax=Lithohypha guttulata TaxID=1690604 RepID=A0ABR0JVC8_9EURO|nr:hypothetical protein LTR24_010097 [Lithohypha guttulata]KAK5309461.1 hypothetical protein LTR70_010274 [Exophiala xenobiotica]
MAEPKDEKEKKKKPNILKRLWDKAGLSPFSILLAVKGALPTTIALAAYEGESYADIYTTLGYLVAIIAHLTLAIQPRAKFIQSMLISVLFVCAGGAMALLQIQCVIAARSTPPGGTAMGSSGSSQALAYDASANTVAGLFLFFWVFVANYVKAIRPQMFLPMIQFIIFVIIASVYGPSFPNMAAAMSFVRRLLITFLTGHAIATVVSLFILPVTSRASVTKEMAGLTKLLKAEIAAHGAYMTTISESQRGNSDATEEEKAAAEKVQKTVIATGELLSKTKLDLGFARKEIAYGKLSPDHFSEIFGMLRQINQPIMGMSTFLEIMRTLRERRAHFDEQPDMQETLQALRKLESEEWDHVVSMSRDAYKQYQKALFLGLDHIAYQLELEKRPKQKAKDKGQDDVEEKAGTTPQPGDAGFAKVLEAELKRYRQERNDVIQDWAEHRNLALPKHFWRTQTERNPLQREETVVMRRKLNQHQLYLVLYMNFLNHSVGQSILQLAKYADGLLEDGTMKKKRLINPGWRRLRKLFEDAFKKGNNDETLSSDVNSGTNIYLGDALNGHKDPEHLPPSNWYEKSTDHLRVIPKALSSEAAQFAFRAAVAAMSLGVIAFLRQTRTFFLTQRGLWAMIMTAISMDLHAGQGVFGFVARIGGTAFAMVMSMVIWYMCNRNHAAILVVFWIYMSCWMLFLIKKPQYAAVSMISSITVVLIIGYELQVDVIGQEVATSNGQEFYPIYLLGPYRLVSVVAGLVVAFFWTYFPFPTTSHGALREDLGSTLYLLANFYSCVHTTLDVRLHLGPAINDLPSDHPTQKLDRARTKVFGKIFLMLTKLRTHANFSKFEPRTGGRFPRETYEEIITSIRNVFTYLGLIVYSSSAFTQAPEGQSEEEIEEETQWLKDFREFAADTKVTSHELTTNLCLLSAAVRNSQPLPPYLKTPRPFSVGEKMGEVDPSLLGVQHFAHPCYAAFAVGEVASAFVTAEMGKITRLVKDLVGEVDFSFHVVSTADDDSSSNSTLWEKEKATSGTNGSSEKKKGD